ncbi:Pilus assembly protein PilO [Parageobacillus genomosp. 1]|uniref:Pilus assembly protein PilO n=1 Tax=Parageobacillus genomosp. 1 TaxID=1295642 RepID=A0ABC9VD80_9BACL|nr:Pilus assembly protein PilO [Parageobacillus genomosp. 1]
MTVRFSKRQAVILLLLFVVFGAIFAGLYFYLLYPRYQEIEQLTNIVKNEKKILAAIKADAAKQQEGLPESVVALQKKIPVRPLTEQLLLDLEKAEVVSNSLISSISFSEGENAEAEGEDTNATTGKAETNAAEEETNAAPAKERSPATALPDGLKKVTVQLTVQSPTYYQLERFLQTLEDLDRIVSVEKLSFAGNPELTSVDTEVNPLTYSLTVSAFYYPKLAELQKLLPQLDVPPPSGKDNPLTEVIPGGQPPTQQQRKAE